MFADKVISQAITRHFEEPVESGICFGIPRHLLIRSGRVVTGLKDRTVQVVHFHQTYFHFWTIVICVCYKMLGHTRNCHIETLEGTISLYCMQEV